MRTDTSESLPAPTAASNLSISAKVKALGRRLDTPGGFTARAESEVVIPSFAKNACSPRTAIKVLAADEGANAGCWSLPSLKLIKNSEISFAVTLENSAIPRLTRNSWYLAKSRRYADMEFLAKPRSTSK